MGSNPNPNNKEPDRGVPEDHVPLNRAALRLPAKSLTFSGLNGNSHQTLKGSKKLRDRMAGFATKNSEIDYSKWK